MLLAAVIPKQGKQYLLKEEIDDVWYFKADTILDFLFGSLVIQRTDKPAMLRIAEIDKESSFAYRYDNNHDYREEYSSVFERELGTKLYKLNDWVIRPVISFDLSRYLSTTKERTLYHDLGELYYSISGNPEEFILTDLRQGWAKGALEVMDAYIDFHKNKWSSDDSRWVRSWIFNNLLITNDDETGYLFRDVTIDEMFSTVKYIQAKYHPVIYKDSDCIRTLEYGAWTHYFVQQGFDLDQAYKAASQRLEALCKGRMQLWKANHLYTPYDKHFSQHILYKTILKGKYNIFCRESLNYQ